MIVYATISKSKENGFDKDRKVSFDFNFGNNIEEFIQLYGTKAAFANVIKGAKLAIQARLRALGDLQEVEGDQPAKLYSDAEITDMFLVDFKLPDTVIEPKSQEEAALQAWEKLSSDVKAALLAKHGQS